MMALVLIIDDEEALVRSLSFALRGEGYDVHGVHTGADGIAAAGKLSPAIVMLDLRLPDMSGQDVLDILHRKDPQMPVVMISAHGDTREAVRAVKNGAVDYLSKPFELDELFLVLSTTLDRNRLTQEIDFHRQSTLGDGALVGDSPCMRDLDALLRRVAASSSGRVLILGESGTGKALVARALHAGSARAKNPFIEINCASLPEQLVEAELFGAEKGAYTGAHDKRVGLVSLAHGGTLFLDEIGELPLPVQAKFLHFLENGSYRAIGSAQTRTADVRVIAATNRDLAAEVKAGQFREDLFYRLNVIQVKVPALRERKGDVPLLAAHFAMRYAREEACAAISFAADAQEMLTAHSWPGNVRELKNLIERLTILMPGREISADDLPVEMWGAPPPPVAASIADNLASTERGLLENALTQASGHKGRAAEILGISRHALKRRLQRLGLD